MSLINREDLIAEYDRVHVGPPGGARKLMMDAHEVVPEPKWIPVSERLPDEDGDYLTTLTDKDGNYVDITEWQSIIGGRWVASLDECDYCEIGNVIAWMPLPEPWKGGNGMNEYKVGQYIIYVNGSHYELGRIKSLHPDGAFVAYNSGETGAKTPYDLMHPLVNGFVIKETLLGGSYFERMDEKE